MFEGGIDLNGGRYDFEASFSKIWVLNRREIRRAFRKIRVFPTHGAPARKDLSPMRSALRGKPARPVVPLPRSIPMYGVRAVDASRKSPRHRGLLACAPGQALPHGPARRRVAEHAVEREPGTRLAHLRRLHPGAIADLKVYRFHRSEFPVFLNGVFFKRLVLNPSSFSSRRLLPMPRCGVKLPIIDGWRMRADDEAKTTQVPELPATVLPGHSEPMAIRSTGLAEGKHGENRLHRCQQLMSEQGQLRTIRAARRREKTTISIRRISSDFIPFIAPTTALQYYISNILVNLPAPIGLCAVKESGHCRLERGGRRALLAA